jgi:hypothetical protein
VRLAAATAAVLNMLPSAPADVQTDELNFKVSVTPAFPHTICFCVAPPLFQHMT